MKTALGFSDIDGGMLDEVGGKAANLGELTRAGLPVPAGLGADHPGLPGGRRGGRPGRDRRDGRRRTGGGGQDPAAGDPGAAGRASRPIREAYATARCRTTAGRGALLGHRRGPALRQLRRAAGHLPQRRRRRGRARRGPPLLGLAVDRPRRRLPRRPTASTTPRVRLAVVVQVMVDAQVAGVMFTANPVTGGGARRSSTPAPGWARPWCPARSTRTTSWSTRPAARSSSGTRATSGWRSAHCPAAAPSTSVGQGIPARRRARRRQAVLPGRRAGARAGRARRPRRGALRRPAGHRVGHRRGRELWLTQSRPITTLYPLPEPREQGLRVLLLRQRGPRRHGPAHPDGNRRAQTGGQRRGEPVRPQSRRPR